MSKYVKSVEGIKYQNRWFPNAKNKDFWMEVLLGRKIMDVNFNAEGLDNIMLDNGEKIYFCGNSDPVPPYIKVVDEDQSIPPEVLDNMIKEPEAQSRG